jgi:hypothetical protein
LVTTTVGLFGGVMSAAAATTSARLALMSLNCRTSIECSVSVPSLPSVLATVRSPFASALIV